MDIWKFFGITHKDHVLCNPLSLKKIDDLIDVIKLNPKSKIVDIATGKGEFLFRITKRYQASGIGVDLSPFHFNEAKANVSKNIGVQLLNMDGASFAKEKLDGLVIRSFCSRLMKENVLRESKAALTSPAKSSSVASMMKNRPWPAAGIQPFGHSVTVR